MKWMQFVTRSQSINFMEANAYIADHNAEDIIILDVRQPSEYKKNHIPGARLIPLSQFPDRLSELDPKKQILVYCAMGVRSRVAAQMLISRGFETVFNVSGGIRAWQAETAVGPPDLGMDLFKGKESVLDVLKVAYSLEQGLCEFYISMGNLAKNKGVKALFAKLSEIEVKHQMSIYMAYCDISSEKINKLSFENMVEIKALEGGMSTKEYLDIFQPDLDSEVDVISLAMSIEAQALDLYQRLDKKITTKESKRIIQKIANEEKAHLVSLGELLDNL